MIRVIYTLCITLRPFCDYREKACNESIVRLSQLIIIHNKIPAGFIIFRSITKIINIVQIIYLNEEQKKLMSTSLHLLKALQMQKTQCLIFPRKPLIIVAEERYQVEHT